MIKLSRFDKTVFLTLAGLFVMTGLLAWRGKQHGVAIITRNPTPGAKNVSTKTSIRVTFDQTIDIARFATKSFSSLPLPLIVQPPVTGTVRWKGSIMTFTPRYPLAPETLYTVTVAENLRSLQGRSLQGERQWQFTTRRPYLLYLVPDQNNVMQLSMIEPATKLARRLSQASSDVEDYTLSPDSSTLVCTISNPHQGSDLWSVRLDNHRHSCVLKCKQETCNHAVWRPDGTRLVYERKASEDEDSRLWWLDLTNGDTVPVFEDVERVGSGAGWSPDGTWLSYIDPKHEELHVYNLKNGRHFNIPNQLGEPPVWHPRQNVLIFSDMLLKGGKMVVHLFRVDPE
jgi:WD40 repeat protein